MSYNRDVQKEEVLALLRKVAQESPKNTKLENFHKAVGFAVDEIHEFRQQFDKFIDSVSHLQVFQDFIEKPLTADIKKLTDSAEYLVTKNYTKEEKENAPSQMLEQINASQEKRAMFLQRIARKYLGKKKG